MSIFFCRNSMVTHAIFYVSGAGRQSEQHMSENLDVNITSAIRVSDILECIK